MTLVDAFELPELRDSWLLVVDVSHGDGSRDRYSMPARVVDGTLGEPSPDDGVWSALAKLAASGVEVQGIDGAIVGKPGRLRARDWGAGRALTDDQSNTSVVLGERLVVKCYRRLLAGTHPEPELLAALDAVGSRRAPRFAGSLARHSPDGVEALVCGYAFVPGEPVGWDPIVERLRDALVTHDEAGLDALHDEAAELGLAAAELHVDLSRAFGVSQGVPEEAAAAVERGRARLAEALAVSAASEEPEPPGARSQIVTGLTGLARVAEEQLQGLALLAQAPVTRVHGDLHVGQFVRSPDGLVVVDFEGEPGLALDARRRPTSPLKDLACLLLSLDHVAVAAARRVRHEDALADALRWSDGARSLALDAYAAGIRGSELRLDPDLLHALEVEKECHELVYAATVLPEWSYAPATVFPRLLDRAGAT